jgi:hypothetical protein
MYYHKWGECGTVMYLLVSGAALIETMVYTRVKAAK